jgi:N-formylglutamate amidohydrolase
MNVFQLTAGESSIVAAAIHSGHAVRPEVAHLLALDDATRRREEDPFTDQLAGLAPTHVVGQRSRFEVDLNRPRDGAVYRQPSDAWGLPVWRGELPPRVVAESLANYDLFYATLKALLDELIRRHGRVVVLDVHSYNHRRDGARAPAAPANENPEINLGTASVDRAEWRALVDRLVIDLRAHKFLGRGLDVRENVKFQGGHFSRWINATYPRQACAVAIEFKKTFMDEWTGELDGTHLAALKRAVQATFPGLLDELRSMAASTTALS